MKVELSDEADAQVSEIDAWWREHRRAAPDFFTDELDRALLALGEMPTLGVPYQAGAQAVRPRSCAGRTTTCTLCRRPSASTRSPSGARFEDAGRGCKAAAEA